MNRLTMVANDAILAYQEANNAVAKAIISHEELSRRIKRVTIDKTEAMTKRNAARELMVKEIARSAQ